MVAMSEETLRLDAVAARVAAWHNRHPLARRIKASQVVHVGVVTLPLVLRPKQRALPAFTEDFLPPWAATRLANWAARHGEAGLTPAADVALRAVRVDGDAAASTHTVGVASAAIDLGALKSRVLIGRGERAAVLGRRLWSPVRLALAALAGVLLLAAAGGVGFRVGVDDRFGAGAGPVADADARPMGASPATVSRSSEAASMAATERAPVPPSPASAALPSEVAVAVTALAAPALVPSPPSPPGAAAAPSPAPSPASDQPPPATAPARPAARMPSLGTAAPRPAIRPLLDDESKAAARDAVMHARQALGWPAPMATMARTAAWVPGAPALPAVAALPTATAIDASSAPFDGRVPGAMSTGPAFALSSRTLRTRAEAEQVMAAARALLAAVRGPDGTPLQVEVLPVGEDWRVAAFPYARRADADRALSLLASRGMRVTVVDF